MSQQQDIKALIRKNVHIQETSISAESCSDKEISAQKKYTNLNNKTRPQYCLLCTIKGLPIFLAPKEF